MTLLSNQDRETLTGMFEDLQHPVRLLLVVDEGCPTCSETEEILGEVAALSEMISIQVLDHSRSDPEAAEYGIDRAPGLAVLGENEGPVDYGIRYFGIPSGYEFGSLVQDIIMVGTRDSGLLQATREMLDGLGGPVHIQVFVTPTCPYCPGAVHLAHQMAFHSPWVEADMVEAIEFPDLARRYGVMGVPRTIINESVHVEGAVPEASLVPKVIEGAGLAV